jgi:hypothetical protein
MTWKQFCHLLRNVISFRRFSHTSRRHNVSYNLECLCQSEDWHHKCTNLIWIGQYAIRHIFYAITLLSTKNGRD